MARKINLFSAAAKIIKAVEVSNRKAQNEAIRQHNAHVRHEQRWQKEQERVQKQREKAQISLNKEKAIQYAANKTNESASTRAALTSIIREAETISLPFEWDKLKNFDVFSEAEPKEPIYNQLPKEINHEDYKAKLTFIDKIFKGNMERKIAEANTQFEQAVEKYNHDIESIREINERLKIEYSKLYASWQSRKNIFHSNQKEHNLKIDLYGQYFEESRQDAVELYFDSILNTMNILDELLTSWVVSYDSLSKILLIDYDLPDKDIIPKLKTMKYVSARKEFIETYLKDKEIDQAYDEILYQLAIRISNDLYFSDIRNQINSVVFNGFFTGINKSAGNEETKCIMSLQTNKNEFMQVNARNVDAKACFLKFKGISGSKLSELVPVAPIIQLNKDDNRFVEGKSVADVINGTNLASMNWEDFEHLIRELFEKEFASNGSEVKITQSSRDGGVDAVMFDPDPIRGGKYIIQAKRYTNVVGVSAVRDLYGTLMNEGAVKGILVTTANYGADSYEFAKGKPITLINGGNLLHMLQKHGYDARIDINEARKMLQG